ncbi:ATP-binding protein [Algihabitans sp.]|uniref:PAS domain-containing hybrid sensor histidine kinase/response regulator n=1 Tax=Algihabitans sp. TaxID=2821514 RepID=UPI003BAB6B70
MAQSSERDLNHYLKRELYERMRRDSAIFDFFEAASSDGLWYWDLERLDQEWLSPRFKAFFGFAEEEMEHSPDWWQANIHPDDLQRALENFEAHKADPDHPYDQVVRYRHRAGHTVWVRCRGLIIRDEAGAPLRMLGAHTDVTDLKRRERELEAANLALSQTASALREARDQAERAANHKSAFLSNMSHEIRTPLTGLVGSLELLRCSALTDEQTGFVRTALHSADVLMSIIDGILNLSKIEAGEIAVNATVFEGRLTFGETFAAMESRAAKKGIAYRCHLAPEAAGWLRSDPEKICQILFNLIGNAIKFTDQGAVTVSLSLEGGASNREDSGSQEKGSAKPRLVISVQDTGLGIAAEELSRIFGRFEQIRDPARASIQGTGLGLAIVTQLCEILEGQITATSEPGKGSTFRCEIPVDLAEPPTAALPSGQDLRTQIDGTVLVAEDNPINQQIISAMLDKLACRYHIVEDGEQAVAFAAANDCAVILMDMQMPVMGGLEAAERIRRLPGRRGRTPIISLSADVMLQEKDKFRTLGIDAAMNKPFKLADLIQILNEHAGGTV